LGKQKDMSLFFQEERDKDFLSACESIRKEHKYLSATDIAKRAMNSPAPSFYLTIKGYSNIINFIKKDKCCTTVKAKQDLYIEIRKRLENIQNWKSISSYELARMIDEQSAPRFYISESRAVKLYYNLLNGIRRSNFYSHNFCFR